MELWIGAVNLGFLYSFMALGVYITYKIYDFPDITVDGSFTTGAAVASVLIVSGVSPFLAITAAFLAGALAGAVTGIIHTRFKINGLLSGILVMTGLYSVNLRIMDKSNIPLLNSPGFNLFLEQFNPGLNMEAWLCTCMVVIMAVFWILLSLFFRTDFGVTMRATGDNPIMVSASGVNVDSMKVFGIALANGFVGISGALVAQYQGFSDIGMGVGAVVFSLASVIIGEALIKKRSVYLTVLSVMMGSVIFRLMVALALFVGLNPNDLKLITAIFVLLTLVVSGAFGMKKLKLKFPAINLKRNRKALVVSGVAFLLLVVFYFAESYYFSGLKAEAKVIKIGIILPNDAEMLTLTRDGFVKELKTLGYENGRNCRIIEQNANGDIPTISTIVDNLINQDVDIFIPISTVSTQAAVKKVKNKPIIFATVANPFIIGVGKSNKEHPSNVTGIYGTAPIKEMLNALREFYPGKIKLGIIWNAAFPNSVNNVELLKKNAALDKNISVIGATITSSGEVYQAAQSLVSKGIDAFFLVPDINVYASFESIVKTARNKKIPIFMNDAEKLKSGALVVYGYDYYSSGRQAAHVVDRIIKGESPAGIDYATHRIVTFGINIDEAKKISLKIPENVLSKVNATYKDGILSKKEESTQTPEQNTKTKRVAIFQFNDNAVLNTTADGVIDGLTKSGVLKKFNLILDRKNANGDFGVAQAIAKDIVNKNYDYIITISTLALQVTANNNKTIPHVFCAVTDPIKAGVAKNYNDHYTNLTGIATPQPVELTVKLMREMFPSASRIGLIWNPSEVNSEICTMAARAAAGKYNFKLIEKTITNTNEVEEALKAVLNTKIDIFFTSGDVTVSVAVPSISRTLTRNKIPYFTNTPDDMKAGAFTTLGADYYEVGLQASKIAERVIGGQKPSEIPIIKYVPENFAINRKLANEYGIRLPEVTYKKADKVLQ